MDRGPIHFSRLKYPHLANARTRSHSRQTRPELAPSRRCARRPHPRPGLLGRPAVAAGVRHAVGMAARIGRAGHHHRAVQLARARLQPEIPVVAVRRRVRRAGPVAARRPQARVDDGEPGPGGDLARRHRILGSRLQYRGDGRVHLSGRFRIGHSGRGRRWLAHRRRAAVAAGDHGRRLPARLSPRPDLRRRGSALRRRIRRAGARRTFRWRR